MGPGVMGCDGKCAAKGSKVKVVDCLGVCAPGACGAYPNPS